MKQISPEDPRLTALAFGELAEDEARVLEAAVAASPAARARLEELRLLARELGAAFAAETAEQAAATAEPAHAPAPEGKRTLGGTFAGEPDDGGRPRQRRRGPATGWLGRFLDIPPWTPSLLRYGPVAIVACLMLAVILIPTVGRVREASGRGVDSSNLRQIAQAYLIALNDLDGKPFPEVADVREFAVELARRTGLNEAAIWITNADFFAGEPSMRMSTVLQWGSEGPEHRGMDPMFKLMPLSIAVALPPPHASDAPTIPLAWTRGLRPDGTWAPDSPFGGEGGFVAYMDGKVSWKKSGPLHFLSHGSGKPTSDLREALPPGTIVSEWMPDSEHSQRMIKLWQEENARRVALGRERLVLTVALSAVIGVLLFLVVRRWGWCGLAMAVIGLVLLYLGWILVRPIT